jgi:3-oxoacyl-[acyl-carrier protein] reductase
MEADMSDSAPTIVGDNPMTLAGRTILVTGAGQGIGRAVVERALALGAKIAAVDLNPATLAEVAAAAPEGWVHPLVGDVADADFVEQAVSEAREKLGPIRGLVNNAGITRPAMIDKMPLESWEAVLRVHLTASFLFTQAVGRDMVARAKAGEAAAGAIVNISSDAGVQGTVGQINYGAAKAGILGLTMSTAREWGKYGIRANSVAFGLVETPMTEVVRSEKFRDTYMSRIPMARFTRPEEAALPVCFLLSDAASYITGQRLSVNGGSQMAA